MEVNEKEYKTPEDELEARKKEESLADKVKIISPGRMVLKRFFRSRLSVIGLTTLVILFVFAFIGPLFSPWGEKDADQSMGRTTILDYRNEYALKISGSDSYEMMVNQLLGQLEKLVVEGQISQDAVETYKTKADEASKAGENINARRLALLKEYNAAYFGSIGTIIYNGEEVFYEAVTGATNTAYLLEKTESGGYERIQADLIQRNEDTPTFNQNASPSSKHWLGTDNSAYDIFTRLMYAGRISLTLGFVVVIIQGVIGIILGGIAGFFGKWVDQIIMRIIDILNCLPGLPLMLIFSSILDGASVEQGMRIYLLMAMLAAIGWTGTARVVRGQILNLREMEFMVAAEALGLSVPRRIAKHLIPNIMPLLIVSMTMSLGGIILTEASLSYLGLGIRYPDAAWGTMINTANDPRVLEFYPNQWIPAGVMIILAVLAFNFVGDGLRDAFDPKMKR